MALLALVCFISLSSSSPHYISPNLKAPFPYPGCMRRHYVFCLIFPSLDASFEMLQVRRGRTEASFTHFSIILLLGWPLGVCLPSRSRQEHREDMEVQTTVPCFKIWNLLPSAVTTETENIPWYWELTGCSDKKWSKAESGSLLQKYHQLQSLSPLDL